MVSLTDIRPHGEQEHRQYSPMRQRSGKTLTFVGHVVSRTGGQESVGFQIVQGALLRGWQVTVIARQCELEHPRLRWIRIPGPARPAALGTLVFSVLAGLAALRHSSGIVHLNGTVVLNRADVATAHFCHHAFRRVQKRFGFRRARRTGIAYRINELLGAWLYRLAERISYRPSRRRALVAVSEGLADELRAYFPRVADTIRVIPNGVSLERFESDVHARDLVRRQLGIPETALAAIFVGGDWERKGVQFAIEAVVDSPRWHLVVVGEGDPRRYAGPCETVNERRIHFVGPVSAADQYLAAGDAFVFPTAYETFSLSTLEAAAAGLPLLVTQVSGFAELVREGVSGFRIERDARSIATCLRRLEADPVEREAIGAGARRAAEEFRWARVLEQYLDLYDELTATKTAEAAA